MEAKNKQPHNCNDPNGGCKKVIKEKPENQVVRMLANIIIFTSVRTIYFLPSKTRQEKLRKQEITKATKQTSKLQECSRIRR